MSRRTKIVIGVAAVPVLLVLLTVGAWAIDSWTTRDQVARNVDLAGTPVGGMDAAELDAAVDQLADQLPATPVVIDAEDFELRATAGQLGLEIDRDRTTERVLETGRDDPLPVRPLRWLESFFSPRSAEVALDVDAEGLSDSLIELEGDRRRLPVEPTIETSPEGIRLVPGAPGEELTLKDVVAALPRTLDDLDEPIRIRVAMSEIPPRLPDDEVAALVERANQVTAGAVTLVAGEQSVDVDGAGFRTAFGLAVEEGTPRLVLQPEPIAEILAAQFPPRANPAGIRFEVGPAGPVPVGGQDARICCTDDAPAKVVDALLAGTTTIELPTRVLTAAEARTQAARLGVKEVIGEFTTRHACCESRVTNIHRMADILRGTLIAPGTTFSVNDTVGRRTVEKGFVEGGVILDGEFTTDIGGGVSQFATTLFNAAFFGGLDIPAYKMHSKYIARYPFGREATLAYPSVDLKIRNDTDYGIVIWPSYTDTSITVQLWSTRTAIGEQTAQEPTSGCGRVTTERTRTFTDGRREVDTFRANYDCE